MARRAARPKSWRVDDPPRTRGGDQLVGASSGRCALGLVAVEERELEGLREIYSRAVANGVAQGPMRGGVESAKYLEWGGYNLDGTWGFSTYRPNLPMTIHQLTDSPIHQLF